MKTGDAVKHGPSGETWTIAYVDGEVLGWCGWPPGEAALSDCTLVRECSEADSVALLRKLATPRGHPDGGATYGGDRRPRMARLRLRELGLLDCTHPDFGGHVAVVRLEDTGRFSADIRIVCRECEEPFRFLGVDAGFSPYEPRVSMDGLELRAPIEPQGMPAIAQEAGQAGAQGPMREPGDVVTKRKPVPGASLQARAESLLLRLRRKRVVRGDVEAEIQAAVIETLESLSDTLCLLTCTLHAGPGFSSSGSSGHDLRCEARSLWEAWDTVRPRLWGRLG